MRKLSGITNDPIQKYSFSVGDNEVSIRLRFLSVVESWVMDVEYNGKRINGVLMSLGVLHLKSYNFPFDFILNDTQGLGLDAFRIDDFSSERVELYILESEELVEIRGYEVAI